MITRIHKQSRVNTVLYIQRVIGWVGAVSLVAAYVLLTFEYVESKSLVFNGMQLFGAVFLGYRVYVDRNWSNLVLQVFFVAVAIYAVVKSVSGL